MKESALKQNFLESLKQNGIEFQLENDEVICPVVPPDEIDAPEAVCVFSFESQTIRFYAFVPQFEARGTLRRKALNFCNHWNNMLFMPSALIDDDSGHVIIQHTWDIPRQTGCDALWEMVAARALIAIPPFFSIARETLLPERKNA